MDERPGVRISFCAHETTHPRHPGDIGDIGDISRKPLKMQGFLNVRTGDISGDIFGDGDFHAQDTLACARSTGRFDAPKTGPLRRIRWEERPETTENDRIAHLRARHPVRVRRAGRFDAIGEPLSPRLCAKSVFGMAGTPPGSTCEGEPFPFWQQFGISEPSPRRSLTPVNSFARRILETSRLDFLNHSLARA